MKFLPDTTLKAWTGKQQRLAQIRQLQDWGYREGRDFWIRRDSSLAVKAELLQSREPVNKPAAPNYSALGPQAQNKSPSAAARIHPARAAIIYVRDSYTPEPKHDRARFEALRSALIAGGYADQINAFDNPKSAG